ncbi:hypothetical protein OSB04_007405 [Centaurea solstitialis]|uniref:Uncharacterized protein n=1 Tax=Centaurea solstitialis TaxID=347529 RepID=A0AA38TJU9_9ASTR|nr:hypothetical protein OSB04_007405 [Centaurea solstitialis]
MVEIGPILFEPSSSYNVSFTSSILSSSLKYESSSSSRVELELNIKSRVELELGLTRLHPYFEIRLTEPTHPEFDILDSINKTRHFGTKETPVTNNESVRGGNNSKEFIKLNYMCQLRPTSAPKWVIENNEVPKQGNNAAGKSVAITHGGGVVEAVAPKRKWGKLLGSIDTHLMEEKSKARPVYHQHFMKLSLIINYVHESLLEDAPKYLSDHIKVIPKLDKELPSGTYQLLEIEEPLVGVDSNQAEMNQILEQEKTTWEEILLEDVNLENEVADGVSKRRGIQFHILQVDLTSGWVDQKHQRSVSLVVRLGHYIVVNPSSSPGGRILERPNICSPSNIMLLVNALPLFFPQVLLNFGNIWPPSLTTYMHTKTNYNIFTNKDGGDDEDALMLVGKSALFIWQIKTEGSSVVNHK